MLNGLFFIETILLFKTGLKNKNRLDVQRAFLKGNIKVVVVTSCSGIEINNVSVRFVVHWGISYSINKYFLESGQAGRDGKPAVCRIYSFNTDKTAKSALNVIVKYLKSQDLSNEKRVEYYNVCIRMIQFCQSMKYVKYFLYNKVCINTSELDNILCLNKCRQELFGKCFGETKQQFNDSCTDLDSFITNINENTPIVISDEEEHSVIIKYYTITYTKNNWDNVLTLFRKRKGGKKDYEMQSQNAEILSEEEYLEKTKSKIQSIMNMVNELFNYSELKNLPETSINVFQTYCVRV